MIFLLYQLFRTLPGGYIVNLYEFYSYKLIGKLTAFLQLQESSLRNRIVETSTTSARCSLASSLVPLRWRSGAACALSFPEDRRYSAQQ